MPEDIGGFVPVATFWFPDEAEVAHSLLGSLGITCYLENQHVLRMVWGWTTALRGLRLMVPAALAEDVRTALAEKIAFNQSEAPVKRGGGVRRRLCLAICILLAPTVYNLFLIYVW